MAYQKYYSSWEDSPSNNTPITADALNHMEEGIANAVPREEGKGLSDNNYTNEDKELVATIENKIDSTNVLSHEELMQILREEN